MLKVYKKFLKILVKITWEIIRPKHLISNEFWCLFLMHLVNILAPEIGLHVCILFLNLIFFWLARSQINYKNIIKQLVTIWGFKYLRLTLNLILEFKINLLILYNKIFIKIKIN